MKVFISYGDAADQVLALRLQALAAVNGLTVYVPPAFTRQGIQTVLNPDIAQKLSESEITLGVIGSGLSEACWQELNAGLSTGKHMIVMSYPEFVPQLEPIFGANLVVIDPAHPDRSERGIVQYLAGLNAQQSEKTALLALGTLALGLVIFAPAEA